MKKLFCITLIILLIPSVSTAAVIFSDDFEAWSAGEDVTDAGGYGWSTSEEGDPDPPYMSDCDGINGTATEVYKSGVITGSGGYGSSKGWQVTRCNGWPGKDPGYTGVLQKRPSGISTEVYISYEIKMDVGYNVIGTKLGGRLYFTDNTGFGTEDSAYQVWYSGDEIQNVVRLDDLFDPSYFYDGQCDRTGSGFGIDTLNDGAWHHLEFYIDVDASDSWAGWKVYIDKNDINDPDFTSCNWGAIPTSGAVRISQYMGLGLGNSTEQYHTAFPTDNPYYIVYDNYVVSTTYTGDSGAPSPTDTDPPEFTDWGPNPNPKACTEDACGAEQDGYASTIYAAVNDPSEPIIVESFTVEQTPGSVNWGTGISLPQETGPVTGYWVSAEQCWSCDDTYTIYICAKDNESTPNESCVTRTFSVAAGAQTDTTAPVISSPLPATDVLCNQYDQTDFNISVVATDAAPSEPLACKYSAAGSAFDYATEGTAMSESGTALSGETWTAAQSVGACDDIYSYFVKCTDDEGNVSAATEIEVTVAYSPSIVDAGSGALSSGGTGSITD